MTQSKSNEIIQYYNTCEIDYRMFWDLDRSMAMHAGFWDETTRTLTDALKRENEILAEYAEIKAHEKVLDAGCGVGGSSIFLAQNYGCEVTGITLSAHQVDKARESARKHGVDDRVTFETMDFCRTNLPESSFDVIWGIESICHAPDKSDFVKEAYRLLRSGGRLIIADGFSAKDHLTVQDTIEMKKWLRGWGVESLDSPQMFEKYLMQTGFSHVTYRNVNALVIPSSKKLYWISFPALAMSKLGELFGLRTTMQTQNVLAAYFQHITLKKGLWEYGILLAHKP
jgi:cyclopropane fatty-acyl-phospholipid synthase-like methyltransferase